MPGSRASASQRTNALRARGLGDDDVRRPSLLPGWTRGRLLTHIARIGDGLRGLAEGVVSGVPATGYASDEARNAAITPEPTGQHAS